MRIVPKKGDQRGPITGTPVKKVTAKPKGVKPEVPEPKHGNKSLLGQTGKKGKKR